MSGLKDLCIFPIKATCNSNELEDINLRAVNPKKNRRQRAQKRRREGVWNEQKATKNQRDAKEADKKKTQKRENVKLIKMKLSRTQEEGGREMKWVQGGEVAEACNMKFIRTHPTVTAQVSMRLRLAN